MTRGVVGSACCYLTVIVTHWTKPSMPMTSCLWLLCKGLVPEHLHIKEVHCLGIVGSICLVAAIQAGVSADDLAGVAVSCRAPCRAFVYPVY